MPEYNIKISELNPFTASVVTADFFPLVDSSSMTTFRANINDIASLMTHSIYADTASVSLFNPTAVSASHANYADSASYAISASHARLADSASYYPPQQFQVSCSWASRSLQSYYATRALDVDTHGYVYNFPYWVSDTPGVGNGNLRGTMSPLSLVTDQYNVWGGLREQVGPLIIDSASTLTYAYGQPTGSPYPWFDYTISRYNPEACKLNKGWGPGGLHSFWPITSQTFVGTDQRFYNFWTASVAVQPWITSSNVYQFTSSYYSGSAGDATSGSWQQIPQGPGLLVLHSMENGCVLRLGEETPAL